MSNLATLEKRVEIVFNNILEFLKSFYTNCAEYATRKLIQSISELIIMQELLIRNT